MTTTFIFDFFSNRSQRSEKNQKEGHVQELERRILYAIIIPDREVYLAAGILCDVDENGKFKIEKILNTSTQVRDVIKTSSWLTQFSVLCFFENSAGSLQSVFGGAARRRRLQVDLGGPQLFERAARRFGIPPLRRVSSARLALQAD